MAAFARSLLLLLVVSVGLVFVIDRVQPDESSSGQSARLVLGFVVGIALVQIAVAILRRRPETWRPTDPLWRTGSNPDHRLPVPAAVRELEALIIGATTGGRRARDRLDRRLSGLGCGTLADQLAAEEPTPGQVTDALDAIISTRTQGTHER